MVVIAFAYATMNIGDGFPPTKFLLDFSPVLIPTFKTP
jgi:hypothetical protein